LLTSIAIPDLGSIRIPFKPDGSLAFFATCNASGSSILSYSRASNGTLRPAAAYTLPAGLCADGLTLSPDGKHLADWQFQPAVVQVFGIASDGTLTPATQPLTVTFDPQGTRVSIFDMTWDSSGSFLLAATSGGLLIQYGGVAVMSFSGNSLAETVYPTGTPVLTIRRAGSFVYARVGCRDLTICTMIEGFDFQNGQLNPLPGSPWTYTQSSPSKNFDMVIY
jgi:hypothetical protein